MVWQVSVLPAEQLEGLQERRQLQKSNWSRESFLGNLVENWPGSEPSLTD